MCCSISDWLISASFAVENVHAYLALHQLLDYGSSYQEHVVSDDEHVPKIKKFQTVMFAKSTVKTALEELVCFLE